MSRQSAVARIAHDVSLAAWFGGTLFGKFILNPAVSVLEDEAERGEVINNAWARYRLANTLTIGGAALSWVLGVRPDTDEVEEDVKTAVVTKDLLLGVASVAGLFNTAVGARFANRATDGAVPVGSGTRPATSTPAPAARDQALLRASDRIELLALLGVIGLSAALSARAEGEESLVRDLLS